MSRATLTKARFDDQRRLVSLRRQRDVYSLLRELEERDKPTNVIGTIAAYLGDIGDEAAISALTQLLDHPEANVRISAALALGKIGDPSATAALIRLLGDEERLVRRSAIVSLGRIRDVRAIPPLMQLLDDPSWFWLIPSAATLALLLMDEPAAREAAEKRLARENWFRRRAFNKQLHKERRRLSKAPRDHTS